jgi:hypothetical protein
MTGNNDPITGQRLYCPMAWRGCNRQARGGRLLRVLNVFN